jgi:hypothetical protein
MIDWLHLQRRLDDLASAIDKNDVARTLGLLCLLVPGYQPAAGAIEVEAPALDARDDRNLAVS